LCRDEATAFPTVLTQEFACVDETARFDAREDFKEGVEKVEPDLSTKTAPTARRQCEIGQEPQGTGTGAGGKPGNETTERFAVETIQKEVGDNEIIFIFRQLVGAQIGVNVLNMRVSIRAEGSDPFPSTRKHAGTGIKAINVRFRLLAGQLGKKPSIPFPRNKNILSGEAIGDKASSHFLQSGGESKIFERSVGPGEGIKSHSSKKKKEERREEYGIDADAASASGKPGFRIEQKFQSDSGEAESRVDSGELGMGIEEEQEGESDQNRDKAVGSGGFILPMGDGAAVDVAKERKHYERDKETHGRR
jgi:hypothetical protein